MSKTEINNEIILMRKIVRAAHVRNVRKWIKESQKLRMKRGTEVQLTKNKRKADKLITEVFVSKKIEDDEVTRFALTNSRDLQEILQDSSSDTKTRVIAKLVNCKILQENIAKFKNKFPEYEQFLQPGKKKRQKLQKEKNMSKQKTEDVKLKNNDKNDEMESEESFVLSNDENRIKPVEDEVEEKKEIVKNTVKNIKNLKKGIVENVDITEKVEKVKESQKNNSPKKNNSIKPVNKVATVKRFTELLKNANNATNLEITAESVQKAELEKEVDTFFTTGNEGKNYMRVVVPKEHVPEEEEESNSRNSYGKRKVSNEKFRNDKFFNKIVKVGHKKTDQYNSRKQEFDSSHERKNMKTHLTKGSKDSPGNFKQKFIPISVKEEHLHPSWQAKKKQQEILKQGFKGKKIVFDDV